jgi:hypothetical protein
MSVSIPLDTFVALEKSVRVKIIQDISITSVTPLNQDTIECFFVEKPNCYLPKYYIEQHHPSLIVEKQYQPLFKLYH